MVYARAGSPEWFCSWKPQPLKSRFISNLHLFVNFLHQILLIQLMWLTAFSFLSITFCAGFLVKVPCCPPVTRSVWLLYVKEIIWTVGSGLFVFVNWFLGIWSLHSNLPLPFKFNYPLGFTLIKIYLTNYFKSPYQTWSISHSTPCTKIWASKRGSRFKPHSYLSSPSCILLVIFTTLAFKLC